MEDGILTDSQGRRVDFRNTVLIMTSNVGSELIANRGTLGFSDQDIDSEESYQDMKDRVTGEVDKVFRPEFLNRLDDLIVFHHLTRKQVRQIADLMLGELKLRLEEEHSISLTLDKKANDLLVERGYDPDYGARPMRRAIERMIENRISELILEGTFGDGSAINVSVDGEEMSFTRGK
jgi:ATP-dependent Clp protease ATP-binding subunit ClpC